MHEHQEVFNVLLSHSRGLLDDRAVAANDGFQMYLIDLPALEFMIEAKRTSKVSYTYLIRSYERRFKRFASKPFPKFASVELAKRKSSATMHRVLVKGKR